MLRQQTHNTSSRIRGAVAVSLYADPSPRHEMHNQEDDADNQQYMEQTGGYVKCEKPKQPAND
jgi:hypothetical protein